MKRRKREGVLATASSREQRSQTDQQKESTFDAYQSSAIRSTNDATKASNWFDDDGKESVGAAGGRTSNAAAESADGVYKGAANYQSFIQKNPTAPSRQVGPVRASANVRTITVTDFAPDVCKDYKQTGFCGFGDSCKFLHAREDYKQGWQLDREWENVAKGRPGGGHVTSSRVKGAAEEDGDDDADEEALLEGIPFACVICKESYKSPIVTRCGHYFCEACALKRYKKTPSCAACGSGTNGVFNGARNLKKLLEKKRERAARLDELEEAEADSD